MRMRPVTVSSLLASLFLVAGCSTSGAITSLDDLTAEVDPSAIYEALPQNRVLSLSGMVPSGEPGRVFKHKKSRSPFTAFGISNHRHGGGSCSSEEKEITSMKN